MVSVLVLLIGVMVTIIVETDQTKQIAVRKVCVDIALLSDKGIQILVMC